MSYRLSGTSQEDAEMYTTFVFVFCIGNALAILEEYQSLYLNNRIKELFRSVLKITTVSVWMWHRTQTPAANKLGHIINAVGVEENVLNVVDNDTKNGSRCLNGKI